MYEMLTTIRSIILDISFIEFRVTLTIDPALLFLLTFCCYKKQSEKKSLIDFRFQSQMKIHFQYKYLFR